MRPQGHAALAYRLARGAVDEDERARHGDQPELTTHLQRPAERACAEAVVGLGDPVFKPSHDLDPPSSVAAHYRAVGRQRGVVANRVDALTIVDQCPYNSVAVSPPLARLYRDVVFAGRLYDS